ncbi:MAG TPA: hypothetical protein VIV11_41050 [Kofleriaceae bacterium]
MRGLVLAGLAVAIAAALLMWLAHPEETAPVRKQVVAERTAREMPSLTPTEESAVDDLGDVREVERPTLLSVRVVDVDRRPVPDAAVNFADSASYTMERERTDATGLAKRRVARGTVRVMAFAGTTWIEKQIEVTSADPQTVELTFDRRAGQKLTVIVQDETGVPIAGIPLRLAEAGERGETGADGKHTFTGLLGGTYRVTVRPRGQPELPGRAVDDDHSVTVATGRTGVITMQRNGWVVGSVDSARAALTQVLVERLDASAEIKHASFVNARFSAEVPPGMYRVTGRTEQTFATANVSVRPGEQTEARLAHVESATLIVTAMRFPEHVPNAGVSCVAGRSSSVMTDERGVATLRDVFPGHVEVRCYSNWDLDGRHAARFVEAEPGLVTSVRLDLVTRESLGVLGANVVPSSDPSIYMFTAVSVDGPAAKAGISNGDLLVTVEGVPATGAIAATAAEYATTRRPGHQLNVGVRAKHGVYVINLTVTIGKL